MGLLHPALLLLAIPVAVAWWSTRTKSILGDALRLVAAASILLALAGPYLLTATTGRDLVIVVDRSLSMPEGSLAAALEITRLAEAERRDGDRVAVVAFGRKPRIERLPSTQELFQGFEGEIDREGSDLGSALETALDLIPERRQGAILVLSDGESNGSDALAPARRAFGRGVRIDVRDYVRPAESDLSVDYFDLPGEVAVGEPFQFDVWVRSDRRVESDFVLRRGDKVLSSGRRVFEAGTNRLVFRDVLGDGGVAEYVVELGATDDRVPENNRGLGAVRAEGAAAILVLNHDGAEDSLVSALRAAGLPVVVKMPEDARLDGVGLTPFRAVVLENVAFARLASGGQALRNFVLDHGGGLIVTGGPASFGVGGYYLSAVDDLLPVSMEMRQEHRKLAVAMAIALDRSGSMGMTVPGGRTKMDLANLGTAAAIELLSPMDSVAVVAIDSAPHVVQPLVDVTDEGNVTSRVRRITSGGGGIFVRTALVAAGQQLESARQINKHVLLFADAADSEEQEDCDTVIAELLKSGVTLSVIALGTQADPDSDFLKRIAKQGEGDIYFTNDPADLPRLFALDTMTSARSTFIDQATAVSMLPDLFGLGALPTQSFPTIGGYNLTYLRPDAQAGMATQDEYLAPIFAFQHRGLGRTAAYTGQIGGTYGGSVVAWEGFGAFFVTALRWLIGNEEPEEFFPAVRREGSTAVISVEVDPSTPVPPDTSELSAILELSDGERRELVLERTAENVFEARTVLEQEGVVLGTVALGSDRFVSLPPLALPYSPEYERSPDPDRGRRLLSQIAHESGGSIGVTAGAFFRGPRESRAWRLISREVLLLGLLALLLEIAGRRLSLWSSLRIPSHWSNRTRKLFSDALAHLPKRRRAPLPPHESPAPPPISQEPSLPPAPSPRPTPTTLGSALSRARRAADKKLDR
jgi:uncharacterized membrane protein